MSPDSVVRVKTKQGATCYAELLEGLPQGKGPPPFLKIERDLSSLEALCGWLGNPGVETNNRHGDLGALSICDGTPDCRLPWK